MSHTLERQLKVCLFVEIVLNIHTGLIKERIEPFVTSDGKTSVKVLSVTTDNGANMLKAVRLSTWPGIECFAHTLQLCIKDGLEEENGLFNNLLYKIRKYASRQHKSTTAERILLNIQNETGSNILSFISDVKTRWNSTFLMLERIKRIGAVVVSEYAQR
jgi:hypothetical protein